MNDMPDKIKSTLKLYADDALLYREIHSPEDSKPYKRISTCYSNGLNAG